MQIIVGALVGLVALTAPETAASIAPASAAAVEDEYTDARADADLELVLNTRGEPYMQARGRLGAHPEQSVAQITDRLAGTPAPPPEEEERLWILLAALAPDRAAPTRRELRPPPIARLPLAANRPVSPDPRMDPRWRARDRRLTNGMIVTGTLLGLTALGVVLANVIPIALEPPDRNVSPPSDGDEVLTGPIDGYAVLVVPAYMLIMAIAAIPLTVVGAARTKHRRPLRTFKASLAGQGLQRAAPYGRKNRRGFRPFFTVQLEYYA